MEPLEPRFLLASSIANANTSLVVLTATPPVQLSATPAPDPGCPVAVPVLPANTTPPLPAAPAEKGLEQAIVAAANALPPGTPVTAVIAPLASGNAVAAVIAPAPPGTANTLPPGLSAAGEDDGGPDSQPPAPPPSPNALPPAPVPDLLAALALARAQKEAVLAQGVKGQAGQELLQVEDSLDSQHPEKFYQVSLDPTTSALEFDLRTGQKPPSGMALEVTVLDANGHEIAHKVKGDGVLSMLLSLAPLRKQGTSTLYLEVSAQPATTGASPFSLPWSVDFSLQMIRGGTFVAPGGSGVSEPSPTPPGFSATSSSSDRPSLASSARAVATGSGLLLATPPSIEDITIEPRPIAVGPLPTRALGPLGGVLAVGDPVPQVDHRESALIDLATIRASVGTPAHGPSRGGEGALGVEGGIELEPLVEVRGPGGFPLLGSPLGTVPQFATGSALAGLTAPTSPPVSVPAAVEVSVIGPAQRSKPRRRAPALTATSFAIVLAVGLTLPDLVESLQFTPLPRFRTVLRRLRRAGYRSGR